MNSSAILKEVLKKYSLVAGLDEAGRGPLAGPVVAGAIAIEAKELPHLQKLKIKDSKKLTLKKRESLFKALEKYFPISAGFCSPQTIDRINILNATFLAMKRSLSELKIKLKNSPDFLIIDGNQPIPNLSLSQRAIPKADENILLVSAASIIAKVTRDRLIIELSQQYPQYGFENHKGYGTREHLEKLKRYGPCSIHRQSFRPVKQMLS